MTGPRDQAYGWLNEAEKNRGDGHETLADFQVRLAQVLATLAGVEAIEALTKELRAKNGRARDV